MLDGRVSRNIAYLTCVAFAAFVLLYIPTPDAFLNPQFLRKMVRFFGVSKPSRAGEHCSNPTPVTL